MSIVSYAQYGEDVVLNRVFGKQSTGFYIDVGANDPLVDSVTHHFYSKGWTGINIEPVVQVFERLIAARPRDINLNLATSDREGILLFHEVTQTPGLSTFNSDLASFYRSRGDVIVDKPVRTTPLRTICEEHVRQAIDFIKIDVEGHEYETIRGMDWRRWRPRVLIIEAGWNPERWEPILLQAGYLRGEVDDECNHFFVREEDRELLPMLRLPANITDDYVPYPLWREAKNNREWEGISTSILAVAKALNKFRLDHPRLASLVKSAIRWSGLDGNRRTTVKACRLRRRN